MISDGWHSESMCVVRAWKKMLLLPEDHVYVGDGMCVTFLHIRTQPNGRGIGDGRRQYEFRQSNVQLSKPAVAHAYSSHS